MLEKMPTMAVLTPLFAIQASKHKEEILNDVLFCEVDDCDCEECESDRGWVIPFTTIRIGIRKDNKTHIVRITPEEAKQLGEELISYSEMVNELSEEERENELERLA